MYREYGSDESWCESWMENVRNGEIWRMTQRKWGHLLLRCRKAWQGVWLTGQVGLRKVRWWFAASISIWIIYHWRWSYSLWSLFASVYKPFNFDIMWIKYILEIAVHVLQNLLPFQIFQLQVVELGQMQDLLSENVDLQTTQIDKIQETIIAATENVKSGNEQVSVFCLYSVNL